MRKHAQAFGAPGIFQLAGHSRYRRGRGLTLAQGISDAMYYTGHLTLRAVHVARKTSPSIRIGRRQ